jgi:two-component system, OmpR family, alkaline phosphatase synthesis response regulator PhoP
VQPLLVYPNPCPAELAQALGAGGFPYLAVSGPADAGSLEPEDGWAGAVVWIGDGDAAKAAHALIAHLRQGEAPLQPLLVVVGPEGVRSLDAAGNGSFEDFVVSPLRHSEVKARLDLQFARGGQGTRTDLVEHGDLVLNLETYQAMIGRRPLDLTYMEYELLKYLAQHPGRVFTRETLLNRVWGYEYYGGARTVDVHIRRLRAKLGEEHAGLIQTVRSVGYRFGQSRWSP